MDFFFLMKRRRIVVMGFMGSCPIAGVIWQHIHYVVGLQRLGHDVYYIEDSARLPYNPETFEVNNEFDYAARLLNRLSREFGFKNRWALNVRRWVFDVKLNHASNCLTTAAGFPATTVFGGTLFVTTDPAATTEFSPIVTPFRMVAFIPIQTLSAIFTGAVLNFGRGGRFLK